MDIGSDSPYARLCALDLGDTLTLPDGREHSVRAVERTLAVSVGTMNGWVLAGEVGPNSTLVSIPASPGGPVVLYTPMPNVPTSARTAQAKCEGVVSYWSPHLPNISGAMGELSYRVCKINGQIDPMVLVWRGRELVVFAKSATTTAHALGCFFLSRDPATTEMDVARHSSVVVSPSHAQAPVGWPAQHPLAQPAPARPARMPFRRG